jgi:hypothetical protein
MDARPSALCLLRIGGSGSRAFKLSIAAVLVSSKGSRFSSESAHTPFPYGI